MSGLHVGEDVKELLEMQRQSWRLAVLATAGEEGPYTSLMSVAVPDLSLILFITREYSRKYQNMVYNPNVSLLFDNRCESGGDLQGTLAITALGRVARVQGSEEESLLEKFLAVHSHLEQTAHSPGSTLMKVDVRSWIVVSGFSDVRELKIES